LQNCTLTCVKSADGAWQFTGLVCRTIFDTGVFNFVVTSGARIKFAVDVKKIAHPENPEEFKANHVSSIYLHGDEPEAKERLANSDKLMYARWDWASTNADKLVNALRLCGHADHHIQAMCNGTRPLCFKDESLHQEFLDDLRHLKAELEHEMGWKNVGFVQSGSSVPGFSTNPLKGIAYQASKITDPTKSDVDLVVVGEGVAAWVEEAKAKHLPNHVYPSCGARLPSGKVEQETRVGLKREEDLPKALVAFRAKWASKFGGGMQTTFALSPTPSLPPWESRLL